MTIDRQIERRRRPTGRLPAEERRVAMQAHTQEHAHPRLASSRRSSCLRPFAQRGAITAAAAAAAAAAAEATAADGAIAPRRGHGRYDVARNGGEPAPRGLWATNLGANSGSTQWQSVPKERVMSNQSTSRMPHSNCPT